VLWWIISYLLVEVQYRTRVELSRRRNVDIRGEPSFGISACDDREFG
jgi:hypothetical protein